jgi:dihydrofolate reductase
MILWGGVSIVHAFTQLGLIDEYRIWVNPVILGSRKPLFKDIMNRLELNLLRAQTLRAQTLSTQSRNVRFSAR